jgi:predicted nucleotidyltransferase
MTADTDTDTEAIRDTVSSVLAEHPVVVGFLFGSQARGDATAGSDIDIAVVFESAESGATDTNVNTDTDSNSDQWDRRLQLDTDLALALDTDAIDVIDLRSAPPALIRTVFQEGERVVGTERDARHLQAALLEDTDEEDSRSPAQRFDDALAAIDDHLA